jgi:hypothetical protein
MKLSHRHFQARAQASRWSWSACESGIQERDEARPQVTQREGVGEKAATDGRARSTEEDEEEWAWRGEPDRGAWVSISVEQPNTYLEQPGTLRDRQIWCKAATKLAPNA